MFLRSSIIASALSVALALVVFVRGRSDDAPVTQPRASLYATATTVASDGSHVQVWRRGQRLWLEFRMPATRACRPARWMGPGMVRGWQRLDGSALHLDVSWTNDESIDRGPSAKRLLTLRVNGRMSDGWLDASFAESETVLKRGRALYTCRHSGDFKVGPRRS